MLANNQLIDTNDISWLIGEIHRLQAERDEAQEFVRTRSDERDEAQETIGDLWSKIAQKERSIAAWKRAAKQLWRNSPSYYRLKYPEIYRDVEEV
jgi:peptidoglycan hydrolase CwlO-like protein